MRWEGTDTALMVLGGEKTADGGKGGERENHSKEDFEAEFKRVYKEQFGFLLEGKKIIVDDIKVRGIGKTYTTLPASPLRALRDLKSTSKLRAASEGKISFHASVYFAPPAKRVDKTPVFKLGDLEVGETVEGPAMIIDETQTLVIVPEAKVIVMGECLMILLEDDFVGRIMNGKKTGS